MASEAQPLLECEENDKEVSLSNRCRSNACRFLESKWGHYSIIILVAADISGIFADFLLKLYICEHTCRGRQTISASFYQLTDLLGIMSLIFSSLFLLELVVSIWAFGIQFVVQLTTKCSLIKMQVLQVLVPLLGRYSHPGRLRYRRYSDGRQGRSRVNHCSPSTMASIQDNRRA